MKNVLAPTNKWVLAATLMAVVGLNASFKPHDELLSQEFASSAPVRAVAAEEAKPAEAKPAEAKKEEPKPAEADKIYVSSIKKGDNTVKVEYRKTANGVDAMVEGKPNCEDCRITVNIKNGNINDLAALDKKLSEFIGGTSVATETKAKEEKAEEKKDPFAGIETECAKKKDKADELTCTADKFLAVLKKAKKGEEIPKEDALDFYKTYIESTISENILGARNSLNQARREALKMTRRSVWDMSWDDLESDQDTASDAHKLRRDTLKTIRTLLSGLPKANEDIRRRLVLAQASMAKDEALELQRTFVQARDSRDPATGLALFAEGNLRREDLWNLTGDIGDYTQMGLSSARSSGNINGTTYSDYMRNLDSTLSRIRSGMWTNPYGFAQGIESTLPDNAAIANRAGIQFPRNNPVITPLPSGVGTLMNSTSFRSPAPNRF